MAKKNIIAAFFICVAIVSAATIFAARSWPTASVRQNSGLETRLIAIGPTKLSVEVAATAAEQRQGLSDRPALASDSGMLFPLIDPSQNGFWMKDMNFPLDFIYFNNGRVVEIKNNVRTTPTPLPFFPSEAVDAVVEVNAGWAASHDIRVGDIMETITND